MRKIKYKIRKASLDDIKQIVNVERLAWPEGLTGDEKKFESRINTFPEGVLVAETNEKQIIGVVVSQVIDYDFSSPKNLNWYQITDNGYIRATHRANGNALFGVDLSVVPSARNKGIATNLLSEIGKLVIKRNLPYALLGGRIPGYHKYQDIPVTEYVKKTLPSGEYLDPELNLYLESGLEIVKIVPNYFRDPESLDYGILLKWENPFYRKNKITGKLIGAIFSLVFQIRR